MYITDELARMSDARLAKTASRSVLGIMNEFAFLAERTGGDPQDVADLTERGR